MPDVVREGSALLSARQGKDIIVRSEYSFSAKFRIKKRSEFCLIQERGSKLFSKHFVIAYVSSAYQHSRIGITVSAKVDKRAVWRNLLKRRVREVFRLNSYRLKENFDIVVIARRGACLCDITQVRREFLGALYHNGLLV